MSSTRTSIKCFVSGSDGSDDATLPDAGRTIMRCTRTLARGGRERFSSGEKFGETASAPFNGQLTSVLQISLNQRSWSDFAERAGESA